MPYFFRKLPRRTAGKPSGRLGSRLEAIFVDQKWLKTFPDVHCGLLIW
jgi:hypothetical protein